MNRLKKYIKDNKIKYVPWAEENKLSPATVYRAMCGNNIHPQVAKRISEATFGEVSVMELLYPKR
jgi:hypothetical protein